MSVRPLEMASEELERRTLTTKPRSSYLEDFAGTLCSLLVSVPVLTWVFLFVVKRIFETGGYCQVLLKTNVSAVVALVLIISVFAVQLGFAVNRGGRVATVAVLLVFFGGGIVGSALPDLGLFHSSPVVAAAHNNNSEYWNNNIKTCLCKNEDCEDLVYREYLLLLYRPDIDYFGFFTYTRVDEAKRLEHAQDLNGTSVKDRDRYSPSFDSRYHEVCYSKSLGDMGNKTLCYSCYGCEEKFLGDEQTSFWASGNALSVLCFSLVVSNVILFLAESWAFYTG